MSATNLTTEPTTAAATIEGLAGRVAALERSARRWRAAAGAVALLAVVVVGMGADGDGADVPQVVKARAFVVVGENGEPVGGFGARESHAVIECRAVQARTFQVANQSDPTGKAIAILGPSTDNDSSAVLELKSNGMVSVLSGGSDKIEVVKE